MNWTQINDKFWVREIDGRICSRIYEREGPYYTLFHGGKRVGDFISLEIAIAADPKLKKPTCDVPWESPDFDKN